MKKHPLDLPTCLDRKLDKKRAKSKKLVALVPRVDPVEAALAAIQPPTMAAHIRDEVRHGRFRAEWLSQPDVLAFFIAQASVVREAGKMSEETKEILRKPKRPTREGMIAIADIAADLKLTPLECRAALRATKTPKPPQGWAFAADQVKHIKGVITSWLAKPTKPAVKAKAVKTKPVKKAAKRKGKKS